MKYQPKFDIGIINYQHYAKENLYLIHEKPLHSPCVTVWRRVAKGAGDQKSFFLDNNINTVCYTKMIREFLQPRWKQRCKFKFRIFQQDGGAMCLTTKITMELLQHTIISSCLISCFTGFYWPTHSPDLSTCDFSLCGYLKMHVYWDLNLEFQMLVAPACDNNVWVIKEWVTIIFTWV